ncbi:hypothetical protein BDZ97DRAFT_1763876 [Flammula alnicola]|nr:hypothetical protein BDZ97DRAFT_1763876 [Flammula alnicola]
MSLVSARVLNQESYDLALQKYQCYLHPKIQKERYAQTEAPFYPFTGHRSPLIPLSMTTNTDFEVTFQTFYFSWRDKTSRRARLLMTMVSLTSPRSIVFGKEGRIVACDPSRGGDSGLDNLSLGDPDNRCVLYHQLGWLLIDCLRSGSMRVGIIEEKNDLQSHQPGLETVFEEDPLLALGPPDVLTAAGFLIVRGEADPGKRKLTTNLDEAMEAGSSSWKKKRAKDEEEEASKKAGSANTGESDRVFESEGVWAAVDTASKLVASGGAHSSLGFLNFTIDGGLSDATDSTREDGDWFSEVGEDPDQLSDDEWDSEADLPAEFIVAKDPSPGHGAITDDHPIIFGKSEKDINAPNGDDILQLRLTEVFGAPEVGFPPFHFDEKAFMALPWNTNGVYTKKNEPDQANAVAETPTTYRLDHKMGLVIPLVARATEKERVVGVRLESTPCRCLSIDKPSIDGYSSCTTPFEDDLDVFTVREWAENVWDSVEGGNATEERVADSGDVACDELCSLASSLEREKWEGNGETNADKSVLSHAPVTSIPDLATVVYSSAPPVTELPHDPPNELSSDVEISLCRPGTHPNAVREPAPYAICLTERCAIAPDISGVIAQDIELATPDASEPVIAAAAMVDDAQEAVLEGEKTPTAALEHFVDYARHQVGGDLWNNITDAKLAIYMLTDFKGFDSSNGRPSRHGSYKILEILLSCSLDCSLDCQSHSISCTWAREVGGRDGEWARLEAIWQGQENLHATTERACSSSDSWLMHQYSVLSTQWLWWLLER